MKTCVQAVVVWALLQAAAFAAPAPVPVSVGYTVAMPVAAQLAVILQQRWDKEAGVELRAQSFNYPMAMLQAAQAGRLDLLLNSPSVLLTGIGRGIDLKIIAAASNESIHLAAVGKLAKLCSMHTPQEAVRLLGRKARIACLDPGTQMDAMLRYWLRQHRLESDVEVLRSGLDQIQQMLASESVDAGIAYDVNVLLSQKTQRPYAFFIHARDLLPGLPSIVLAARGEFLQKSPQMAQTVVALHERASRFIQEHPQEAAAAYSEMIDRGLIPRDILAQAFEQCREKFTVDPRPLLAPLKKFQELLVEAGGLKAPLDLEKIIDTAVYEHACGGKP